MAGMKNSICTIGMISLLLSWSAQGQSILPVEYSYDSNGNMNADANKDISAIHYNLLDLPDTITYTDGRKIVYAYTATGQKIRQQVFRADGTVETKRDYAGQFLYENDLLQTLDHEDGRVVLSGTTPEYQYHLKDHLGNVRMTVTSVNETVEYLATMEGEKASEEGLLFDDIGFRSGNGLANHTPEGNEAIYLSAGVERGASLDLAVSRGDVIYLQVYAYYENGVISDPWPGGGGETSLAKGVTTIVSAVAGALSGGVLAGEGGALLSSGTTAGSLLAAPSAIDESAPVAYLNYELFNKNYSLVDGGFRKVSSKALFSQELLMLGPIEVTESGYLHVYLNNLSARQGVYFDDLKVQHIRGQIVQEDSYDPFGMPLAGLHEARFGEVENRRLYNGKELQNDHDLNWYDYGARMYDAVLGRWNAIDPLSDKYASWSPYQYVMNNPMKFIDPDGQETVFVPNPSLTPEQQQIARSARQYANRVPAGRQIFAAAHADESIVVYIAFVGNAGSTTEVDKDGKITVKGSAGATRRNVSERPFFNANGEPRIAVSAPGENRFSFFDGFDVSDARLKKQKIFLIIVEASGDPYTVAQAILHEIAAHVNLQNIPEDVMQEALLDNPMLVSKGDFEHYIFGETTAGCYPYSDLRNGKAVVTPGCSPVRPGSLAETVRRQLATLKASEMNGRLRRIRQERNKE
jgi:RHS repeat-associated protein